MMCTANGNMWEPRSTTGALNESDSLLHSEFGVDGVNNLPALKTILAPENQGPFSPVENLTWRHHGETWDTLGRDEAIFGKFASLRDFVIASQFVQGEGLRYAVEANRRRAYQNSGSIIWQSNEPWVNTSCTNLIDYYRNPQVGLLYGGASLCAGSRQLALR